MWEVEFSRLMSSQTASRVLIVSRATSLRTPSAPTRRSSCARSSEERRGRGRPAKVFRLTDTARSRHGRYRYDSMAAAADRSLAECAPGERFRIARVTDQSPEFLRYLSHAGLEIGAQGALLAHDPAQGGMTLQVAECSTTLSKEAAEKIMVR